MTDRFDPTDEDVEKMARAICGPFVDWDYVWSHTDEPGKAFRLDQARRALAAIGPIVERERRAAKVEALDDMLDMLGPVVSGTTGQWVKRCRDKFERGDR